MNYLRLITTLFNSRQALQMFGLFRNRRNNRGTMLWTLIGIVVTLAAASFIGTRGRNNTNQMLNPIRNVANTVQNTIQNANVLPFKKALAEFANELTPQKDLNIKNIEIDAQFKPNKKEN